MTMTVGELIAELSDYPPDTPVFFYDPDKQMDRRIDTAVIEGPILEPDGADIVEIVPGYCRGQSRVERHWYDYGTCPVVYLMEDYFK